ncbi:tryptophan synthase subunit alpha [Streptomyces sp. NBC_01142]|uniref:tryptophan synthase subunit alpha n=1 Tax=Streptomyces sp. NBC_01142 TaxID=2975865 RepID=UPI0022593582|nr:tryptophan synthase subunit alpha [Streptomyces sp. NBC_01142]MCX4826561.1 tryptophan synthase subunit alpha [Streptomyces sp. NBC_01142]
MTTLTPAATGLTALLTHRQRPALGAFLPAGFPNWTAGIETLRAFTRHGADFLEVGVPHHTPTLDGPDISAAYAQALGQGARMAHVFSTIRLTASSTAVPVVAMSYWAPVLDFGIQRFAQDLAQAGAAGAMIPDLPASEAGEWIEAARKAGIHTPQFAPRSADDDQLAAIATAASGWIYAPAAPAPTGYQGELDLPALNDFTARLRTHSRLPVVGGIGISTPQLAEQVAPFVDAVVIGSPLIRPLLQGSAPAGLDGAVEQVRAFAHALHTPASSRPLSA